MDICDHFQFPYHVGSHIPSLRTDPVCVVFLCAQIMVGQANAGDF